MVHRNRATRAAFPAASVLTIGALALTACATPSDPGTSATTGGTLVVGITADPDTLFPWKATQFQAINVLQNIYGTLTQFDAELNVVPGLAEAWEASDDGTTLTFTLRDGVTFADGSDFDSADVVSSLEQIRLEETAAVGRASLAAVTEIEATGDLEVTLTLSAPDAALPANLAEINMAMLSSEDTEESLSVTPNGTGAFTFESRVANESLTITRNDSYWGDAAPLDGVEFRVIPDESSIVAALQSGNVNLAVLNDPLVAETAESSGLAVAETPQLAYHALMLNSRSGELGDADVRRAIQCAIDRQEVLDTAALGEGAVTGPITSPAYRSDADARPCPARDLDAAREYLAAAGLADGFSISTIVSQGSYATSVNEAQSLAAQLEEIGITLELEVLESGAYVDRWIAGDFEAAVALNSGRPDPDGMYGRYFTSAGNLNAVAGYSSETLDALFAAGKSSTDPAERASIYDEIAAELENEAVWIWLFTSFTYTATTENVSGFTPMSNGSLQFLRTVTLSS